jgi:CubicO group peptidase (beta-lactamase class C family)
MLIIWTIFILNPTIACSQITTISGANLSERILDDFLIEKMEALKIPGLSIAIINNNKVIYDRNLGITNAETKQEVDENTIFEAASLSKPLFAYFVFKMVEKGLIDLDKPLYKYLPNPDLDHDERYKQITARQVLCHTTGLPNWRYFTNKMMYLELLSNPGERFIYSGEAYEYLANAIVHVNKGTLADLGELLQKELLNPLQMDHSGFVWSKKMDSSKAYGHALPNIPNSRFEPLLARVSGGLHTNARDYAKFMIALMQEQGINKASFEEMLKPAVVLPEGHEIRDAYGVEQWTLGFAWEQTRYGIKHSHGGNNGDFQSYMEFYKDSGIGYVFMTNCNKGDELNIALNELLTKGEIMSDHAAYDVINRSISTIKEEGFDGITMNARQGAGICWLKDQRFQEGIIEFDVRGENKREKSFVGIAFHGQDDTSYDCIYFRPYLFDTESTVEKNYMVQYIAMPQYDWFNLRSDQAGVFESQINNAPKAESWFHVKIEVKGKMISVFVNDQETPALQVEKLNSLQDGKIGFWVGNASKGDFANLKIIHQ